MSGMNYADQLRELLRPLKLYDVDGGLGGAELTAEGAALDRACAVLMEAENEFSPATAGGYGLDRWEALLPFIPAYRTAADRRRAISALLRIDGASFTPDAINDTIAGCGIRAVVKETDTPMTVSVSFTTARMPQPAMVSLMAAGVKLRLSIRSSASMARRRSFSVT